jgi:hypothetical protein
MKQTKLLKMKEDYLALNVSICRFVAFERYIND